LFLLLLAVAACGSKNEYFIMLTGRWALTPHAVPQIWCAAYNAEEERLELFSSPAL
jgi:hypothetical protein